MVAVPFYLGGTSLWLWSAPCWTLKTQLARRRVHEVGGDVDETDTARSAGGREGHAGAAPRRQARHRAALDRRHAARRRQSRHAGRAARPRTSWLAANWCRTTSWSPSSPTASTSPTPGMASSSTAFRARSPQALALDRDAHGEGPQARRRDRAQGRRSILQDRIENRIARDAARGEPLRSDDDPDVLKTPHRCLSRADGAPGGLLPRAREC